MNIDFLTLFVLPALGLLIGFLGKVVVERIQARSKKELAALAVEKEIEKKRQKQITKANLFLMGLESVFRVHLEMDTIEKDTPATRVYLVKLSNGGSTPKPGSTINASGVYAECETKIDAQKLVKRYQKVRVDDQYIKMCIDAANNPTHPVIIDVENAPDSILKQFYMAEGIKYSEVYWIYTDGENDSMYIMSVATHKENERFEATQYRVRISLGVQKIMNEFDKYNTNKHLG